MSYREGTKGDWRFGALTALMLGLGACSVDEVGDMGDESVDGKADDANSSRTFCDRVSDGLPTKFRGIEIEGPQGYVAQALACEAAEDDDPEYLKALAVAIRSIAIQGAHERAPCDNGCQPLCKSKVKDAHVQAVQETKDEFLWYGEHPIFGFHTVGTAELDKWCLPQGEIGDRSTPWNACKSEGDVQRSKLGYKAYDRGALNHDTAQCLAERGRDYTWLLRTHYGEDIGIGCGMQDAPSDECIEEDPEEIPTTAPSCGVTNYTPETAEQLPHAQDDGFWNWGQSYERKVAPEAPSWFKYEFTDKSTPSDVEFQVTVWDNDPKFIPELPDLTVCQYFQCNEGIEVMNAGGCGDAEFSELEVMGEAFIGCCVQGFGAVSMTIEEARCDIGDTDGDGESEVTKMDGQVWISIEQHRDVCEENIYMELDLD